MTPAKRLLLIRHAKSARPPGVADHDRPLAERGVHDARAMGTILSVEPAPDAIVVSSARRARETIELLVDSLASTRPDRRPPHPQQEPRIYLAEPETIWLVAFEALSGHDVVWLCGHNPAISDAVVYCADVDLGNVPTLGVIGIGFEEITPTRPNGRLLTYYTPAAFR